MLLILNKNRIEIYRFSIVTTLYNTIQYLIENTKHERTSSLFDTRYNIETFLMRRGTRAAKTRISWLLLFLQYGMNKLLEPEFHRGEVSCVTGRHEDDHTVYDAILATRRIILSKASKLGQ